MIILHGMASAVRDKQYRKSTRGSSAIVDLFCLYCFKSPFDSFHKPSIYLSTDSHCVFPVDIKYRICVCHVSISIPPQLLTNPQPTRSVTALFRSNSALASCLTSRLVFSSTMRLELRRTSRQSERTLPLCKNCSTKACEFVPWFLWLGVKD